MSKTEIVLRMSDTTELCLRSAQPRGTGEITVLAQSCCDREPIGGAF